MMISPRLSAWGFFFAECPSAYRPPAQFRQEPPRTNPMHPPPRRWWHLANARCRDRLLPTRLSGFPTRTALDGLPTHTAVAEVCSPYGFRLAAAACIRNRLLHTQARREPPTHTNPESLQTLTAVAAPHPRAAPPAQHTVRPPAPP